MRQLSLFDLTPFTHIPDVKRVDEEDLRELEENLEWLNSYFEEEKGSS